MGRRRSRPRSRDASPPTSPPPSAAGRAGSRGQGWAAYLSRLDRVWTPWSNTRTDRWGGSLVNRNRVSRRVIEAIRRACGEDFVIGLAVSVSDARPVPLADKARLDSIALPDATGQGDHVTCGLGGYLDFERLPPTLCGQIAEPHLARKTAEGRAEDLRGCLSCNEMCCGRRTRDYEISCLFNPSVGREWEWGGEPLVSAATSGRETGYPGSAQ